MDIRRTIAALMVLGLLTRICSPAWSADSGSPVEGASATVSSTQGTSLPSILRSVFKDNATAAPKRDHECKASQIYSQHDVEGDPETCTMNRATFGGAR
jgi:hypothetical protein